METSEVANQPQTTDPNRIGATSAALPPASASTMSAGLDSAAAGAAPQPSAAPTAPAAAAAGPTPSPAQPATAAAKPEPAKPENVGQKMIHGILAALGGTTDVQYSRDPETGKLVATHVKIGPGQQWKRIAAGALAGAAAGMSVKPGPGVVGRAAGAGFTANTERLEKNDERKYKRANEDAEFQDKAMVARAHTAWYNQETAASVWRMTREKTEFSKEMAQSSATLFNLLHSDPGNKDLGTYASFADFVKDHGGNAEEIAKMNARGELRAVPEMSPDGTMHGVHIVRVTPAWDQQKTSEDIKVDFGPVIGKDGKATANLQTIPAGSTTNGQAATYQQASVTRWADYHDKEAKRQRDLADARKLNMDSALVSAQIKQMQSSGAMPSETELAGLPQDQRQEKVLSRLTPTNRASIEGVLKYRVSPETFPAILRKGTGQMDRQTALGIVRLAKPEWTQEKYQQAQKLYNDYASKRPGTAGGNVLAFNTGIAHLGQLNDAGQALAQHNIQWLNKIANAVGAQAGSEPQPVYDNIVNILTPEIVKATKGNVTEEDIKSVKGGLGSQLSPQQRKGVVRANSKLLFNKLMQQQAEDTAVLGEPLDFKYISDESKRTMDDINKEPVYVNGGLVGYTLDGKTMMPAQQQ